MKRLQKYLSRLLQSKQGLKLEVQSWDRLRQTAKDLISPRASPISPDRKKDSKERSRSSNK
jgi:hypothetical protein